MCTVSFIPTTKAVYLTSNRDESLLRSKALMPERISLQDNAQLLFPKDPDGGGTWVGLKSNGDAAVLLNGAFEKHEAKPPYRKSRGAIFLDVIQDIHPLQQFLALDLTGIEPFTLVLYTKRLLYECRWDGTTKLKIAMNSNIAHIWSSATLYSRDVQKARQEWFDEFLQRNNAPVQEDILAFHRNGGRGDASIDLQINLKNKIKTVSITSIIITGEEARLDYFDVELSISATETLLIQEPAILKEAAYA